MRTFLQPRWLFLTNTLPIFLISLLLISDYRVFHTLLEPDGRQLIMGFAGALGGLWLLNIGVAWWVKKEIPTLYSLFQFLANILFLYVFLNNIDKAIGLGIVPQWMFSGNWVLLMLTALMPTLVHSLLGLVLWSLEKLVLRNVINFVIAIGVPAFWYFLLLILTSLQRNSRFSSRWWEYFFGIGMTISVVIFLFFLLRGLCTVFMNRKASWNEPQRLFFTFLLSLAFPLLGLAINHQTGNNFFGNFESWQFYTLTCINAVLLLVPNEVLSLPLKWVFFVGRSATMAYTFYFFLVFLPYLPMSILFIIALGAGFLMLTPLMLFVVHGYRLQSDFVELSQHFSKKRLLASGIVGFLLLPMLVTGYYMKDKKVLDEALEYAYRPNPNKQYDINTSSLKRTLENIQNNKENARNRDWGTKNTPYLTPYFNFLVLKSMTLSDTKLAYLEDIFIQKDNGQAINYSDNRFQPTVVTPVNTIAANDPTVKINNITSSSQYDPKAKAWRSWVNLELLCSQQGQNEYQTTLTLPDGVFVSNMYLYIEGRKEMGILAEKKSAIWIYNQIRNIRRDPALLHYTTGNQLNFQVFPFAIGETRKTGIELLHQGAIDFQIDGKTVHLGKDTILPKIENSAIHYLTAAEKATLPEVQRKPYFHFLIAVSDSSSVTEAKINKLLAQYPTFAKEAQYTLVDAYTTKIKTENWQKELRNHKKTGGFFLERAMKEALTENRNTMTFPIPIVITDSLYSGVLGNGFMDFQPLFPENSAYYEMDKEQKIWQHSLLHKNKTDTISQIPTTFEKVRAYPTAEKPIAFLKNDNAPSLVIEEAKMPLERMSLSENAWENALNLQARWQLEALHPYAASDKSWLMMLQNSFKGHTLHPTTSFIALENEAQKAALKRKQEQVMNGSNLLDAGEEPQRMDEPNIWVMLGLLLVFLWWRRK